MSLRVGDSVPDIRVEYWLTGAHAPAQLSLADYRGQWLVLFFYPRDFTFICPTEISAFAALQDEFASAGARIVAASTDSFFSHEAWFRQEERLARVDFPVIADTSHRLAQAFNVLLEDGSALRATFIIDPKGIIRHASMNEIDIGRNVEEILRIVRALQSGELCPAGWKPGDDSGPAYNEWLEDVFPTLSRKTIEEVSGDLHPVRYNSGDIIIRQGDRPDRFYIVVEGEVSVIQMNNGGETEIARLGPGEMFGEMGILMETRRTADVRASTDVSLLALDWNGFRKLVESSEQTARDFMHIVEQRRARSESIGR
jgi:peroxiredoxin 2/4